MAWSVEPDVQVNNKVAVVVGMVIQLLMAWPVSLCQCANQSTEFSSIVQLLWSSTKSCPAGSVDVVNSAVVLPRVMCRAVIDELPTVMVSTLLIFSMVPALQMRRHW